MWHLKYNNQTNRCVVYLKKRFPHREQFQESRGAAPVVVAPIPYLTSPKIKQYLTIKNQEFYYVCKTTTHRKIHSKIKSCTPYFNIYKHQNPVSSKFVVKYSQLVLKSIYYHRNSSWLQLNFQPYYCGASIIFSYFCACINTKLDIHSYNGPY